MQNIRNTKTVRAPAENRHTKATWFLSREPSIGDVSPPKGEPKEISEISGNRRAIQELSRKEGEAGQTGIRIPVARAEFTKLDPQM